ncbi:uncharacterized protein LOC111212711 [Brassica napus]|uniref:uncharacterized protein LOC106340528 n=1 Tax=Brassica oleracea var. oleracea TaxID=109376 RepID=UPI0006A6D6AB|nr:PREDICTED: uncharacterized protein LOC106340528 [Brassica oleracea var. oleracea]XP_048612447.1 uncharacterized protein LOC111212711 [Brassica napus]
MDVNQWIQKTVRSLLMSSSGSSSVSSLMPDLQRGSWMNLFSWGIGFRSHNAPEFESLSDTKDKLETRRKDVHSRSNPKSQNRTISPHKGVWKERWSTSSIEETLPLL